MRRTVREKFGESQRSRHLEANSFCTIENTQLIASKKALAIGFKSQKRQQAAEQRAAEAHNLKKQEFELKKKAFELKKERVARPEPATPQNWPAPIPETSPEALEMAA